MNRFALLLVATIMVVFTSEQCGAQERQRFDGGMMIHTGYLHGDLSALHYEAKGPAFGLGGVLHFHLGRHFRVGGEGAVSTLRQMKNGSFVRVGWGGLLADAYLRLGRWQPYIGLSVGGGKSSLLLLFDGSADDWAPEPQAILRNERFFFVNPYVGVEFALTQSIHLTLKADRLVTLTPTEMPNGMRFYVGVLFVH